MDALFGDVIHRYSREQAIEDGVLHDVTEWAGLRKPDGSHLSVVFTAKLWSAVKQATKGSDDVRGRAHDVLFLAKLALRKTAEHDFARFKVILPVGRTRTQVLAATWNSFEGVTIGFSEDEW